MKLWNLAISTSSSRVLLCLGSCTFVTLIYKCLYFCHSYIQVPVLLSLFLSTAAKTFCALPAWRYQASKTKAIPQVLLSCRQLWNLAILTSFSKQSTVMPRHLYFCHSYIQVPVLLPLLYTNACTFVTLIYKCLYLCHSYIQVPVLLSLILSTAAKTFCALPVWRYQASKSKAIAHSSSTYLYWPKRPQHATVVKGEFLVKFGCITVFEFWV